MGRLCYGMTHHSNTRPQGNSTDPVARAAGRTHCWTFLKYTPRIPMYIYYFLVFTITIIYTALTTILRSG